MVPFKPFFDPLAQMTDGLVAFGLGPIPQVNGVALVTGFLFGQVWNYCGDDPVTSWTLCTSPVTTTWSDSYVQPTTIWAFLDGEVL